MPKPKILVCGPPISAAGGVPTHLRNLFSSDLRKSYELVHFEVGSRGRESPSRDESLVAKMWRLLWSPLVLVGTIAISRPAVVHLNTTLDRKAFWRDFVYLLISRMLGRRVLLQIHGGKFERLCGGGFTGLMCRVALPWSEAVVVLSHIEQEALKRSAHLCNVVVIPNAIDLAEYQPTQGRQRKSIRRLLYLGRLAREKGLLEMLEALALLVADPEFAHLELLIVGTGPLAGTLQRQIHVHGLERNVRLRGSVFGKEKVQLLQEADLLLLPSYSEGLPYSILESLAVGTPVVATMVGSIPEVVEHGRHGLLVQPGSAPQICDAIRALARHSEGLPDMSERCSKQAQARYGLEGLARDFDRLYRRVVGSQQSRSSLGRVRN